MPSQESGHPEAPVSAGREERFREIFFEYHRPVVSFFQRRGSSYEESLDLAQETFLRVFKGMESFHSAASIATWVYTIADNVRLNALRSQGTAKRSAVEEELEEKIPADLVADDDRGALHGMLVEERTRVLREALLVLPPQMRRCAELRLYSDLKYDEIAHLMRISIQTVRSQLFEARRRLKDKLEDYFTDEELG